MTWYRRPLFWASVLCTLLSAAQTPISTGNPIEPLLKPQSFNRPENCLPCHQRQYAELRGSVKAGYRNVSPLFNGLEFSSNLLVGGLLRPVYHDSTTKTKTDGTPLTSNLTTTPSFTDLNQVRAGFCLTCHNANAIIVGDADATKREFPELAGIGAAFQPELLRPYRDYALVDSNGSQIIPTLPGDLPPAGAKPSLGAAGITCDFCHNVAGPDMNRSFQHDGYANMSLTLNQSVDKVGPFFFPAAVKGNFHTASRDPNRIAFLRSGDFCNGCHDVRVPLPNSNLQAFETDINSGGSGVTHYRLENLSSEWRGGAYNSTINPFGKVIRCQDCHMSLFPYAGSSTYKVGDQTITSPTPAVFPQNYAAVNTGVATEFNFPLEKRQVVTHYLTGVDTPIMSAEELQARLGPDYPDPYDTSIDEYGLPRGIAQRRADLMRAAVRINLDKSDKVAKLGGDFMVRVVATALTGHRFPAGFSQERTAYIELTVKDANGFLLYQSGYQVDKPHPDTGEVAPDGSLDDEDLEHVTAVVDPGRHVVPYATGPANNGHRNQVFLPGPDDGPDARVYGGEDEGLVLFRNELTRIFLPGETLGHFDADGNAITAQKPHYEETFSASFANTVDNFRSLTPLRPTLYRYKIKLPTAEELQALGVSAIQGPLQIHAQVNFEHFPPLFLRFLARATGPEGPTGHDIHLLNEQKIDTFLKNVRNITTADIKVEVTQ